MELVLVGLQVYITRFCLSKVWNLIHTLQFQCSLADNQYHIKTNKKVQQGFVAFKIVDKNDCPFLEKKKKLG